MISAGAVLLFAGIALIFAACVITAAKPRGWRDCSSGLLIAGNATIGLADIFNGAWPWSLASFACAAVLAWLWWHRRKRRKRARGALGAKSRALRDALVRRTREAAQPRPVLRPVPGGVR